MSAWDKLFHRALGALDSLAANGTPLRRWALGGGTALMIHHWHRTSKDIDLFIDDPQYLGLLSPRLNDHFGSDVIQFVEAAHYLKVEYAEGEIDVIVSGTLSRKPLTHFQFFGRRCPIETPLETAIKKLVYRGAELTARDVFDLAVVAQMHGAELRQELGVLIPLKRTIQDRLATIPPAFLDTAFANLGIYPHWDGLKGAARDVVADLLRAIPDAHAATAAGEIGPPVAPWQGATSVEAASSFLLAMTTSKLRLREAKAQADLQAYLDLALQRRDLARQAAALDLIAAVRNLEPALAALTERLAGRSDGDVRARADRAVSDQEREPDGPEM